MTKLVKRSDKPLLGLPRNAKVSKHVLIGTVLSVKGLQWMVITHDEKGYTLKSLHSGEEHLTSKEEMAMALGSGFVDVIELPVWAVGA